jgi:hypothetical protein
MDEHLNTLHLGALAHDFGRSSTQDLALRVATKGLTCVQLAPGKAIEGLALEPGMLNPGLTSVSLRPRHLPRQMAPERVESESGPIKSHYQMQEPHAGGEGDF